MEFDYIEHKRLKYRTFLYLTLLTHTLKAASVRFIGRRDSFGMTVADLPTPDSSAYMS